MKIDKISLIFDKAPFPAIMTTISFILFTGVYLFINVKLIEPYYFGCLLYAMPFVCFGLITFYTINGKVKIVASSIITVILIFVLGFAMIFVSVKIMFSAASTVTTDAGKYKKVLKFTDYPNNPLIKYFPNKIPDNAKNIVFRYSPSLMQGDAYWGLKFETNSASIMNYEDEFSHKATWIGKPNDSEAEANGIPSILNTFGYTVLPDDFTIYQINSNSDFHDNLSFVAISEERNEIIFSSEGR